MPVRFTRTISDISSPLNSSSGLMPPDKPALFIQTSTFPQVSTACARSLSGSPGADTSAAMPDTSNPCSLSDRQVSSTAAGVREHMTTLAPSRAHSSVMARPMPLVDPVTTTTLSFSFMADSPGYRRSQSGSPGGLPLVPRFPGCRSPRRPLRYEAWRYRNQDAWPRSFPGRRFSPLR